MKTSDSHTFNDFISKAENVFEKQVLVTSTSIISTFVVSVVRPQKTLVVVR